MRLVFDLETDGLLATVSKVFCCGIYNLDTKEHYIITDTEEMLDILSKSTTLIGHNIIGYDLLVLDKLFNFKYDHITCIDTKLIAQFLYPDKFFRYSLNVLSKYFLNDEKLESPSFTEYSKEMDTYCLKDVELTARLFMHLEPMTKQFNKALDLEYKFAKYMTYQMANGFTLDVIETQKLYDELKEESDVLYKKLQRIMPTVKDLTAYKKKLKEDKIIEEKENSFIYVSGKYNQIKEHVYKESEPNPSSRQQITNLFIDKYEWEPVEFTDKNTPKIDETILNGLDFPESHLFAELFQLNKKLSMIKNDNGGWLHFVTPNNTVHGQINTMGANTSRCTHSLPNMAQIDKRLRKVWIPKKDYVLIDMDASGLELRLLAHYLYNYDNGAYADVVLNGDVHTYNKELVGLNDRNNAKTFIYALIYGAGNEKLGTVIADDLGRKNLSQNQLRSLGNKARAKVMDNLDGYKELMDDIKIIINKRKYLLGIDGRKLYPRSDYSALNLLIQSAGAIICKQWVVNMVEDIITNKGFDDWGLCANVHDEQVIEAKEHLVDYIIEAGHRAISKTKEDLKVKIDLAIEAHTGVNWDEIH